MKKWLIAFTFACLMAFVLSPSVVLADSSRDITVTATGYVCDAPGGLTLTYISDYEVGISWAKGTDAENTMVRAAVGRLPESRTDGYLVYYGDGTSTSDTGVSLDETAAPIYYRAWSQNAGGVWEEVGTSNSLEGLGVTILAVVAIILVLMAMGFVFKNGILFLASALGWILFAFLMFGKTFDNAALNTGLLLFGGAMAIICAVMALNMLMSGRGGQLSEDAEYEAYKKEVMKATRRRT